jgi:hypothetical protein
VSTILDIASRAYELFKSSEQDKKRAILKLLFSNFFLSGKTLVFTVVKPFDEVLKCGERPIWLHIRDESRTKIEREFTQVHEELSNVYKGFMESTQNVA